MRALEFLTEWMSKKRVGNVLVLVSEHVQDQARDRGIPWGYVERIQEEIFKINTEKLEQLLNFTQFYVRDNETWAEVGCKVRTDGEVIAVYINTVVRREPNIPRNKSIPTLYIN